MRHARHDHRRRALRAAAASLAAASLAACGFRLRRAAALPPELARVHVRGDDLDLVARIADALAARGAIIESGAEVATLRITAGMTREVLSTDASGRATAYSLIYAVRYQLRAPSARAREESFSLRRAFDYAAAQHLQAGQESRFLEDDLRREAAARVLSQLARE